jgi:hypothetical protein
VVCPPGCKVAISFKCRSPGFAITGQVAHRIIAVLRTIWSKKRGSRSCIQHTGSRFNLIWNSYLFRCILGVVLLAINLTACAILLFVDLSLFLACQLAAVCSAVGMDLLVDALFAILGACGFARGH